MKNQTAFFSMVLQTCGCAVWYTHYRGNMENGCKRRINGMAKNGELFI